MKAKDEALKIEKDFQKFFKVKYEFKNAVEKAMIEFAKSKCKEQDRNTRHNAAETILLKAAQAKNPIMDSIAQELHQEIMNLKSKTPDFE